MSLKQTLARWLRWAKQDPTPDMRNVAPVAMVWDKHAEKIAASGGNQFPRFLSNANDLLATHADSRFARKRLALLEVFSPSRPIGDKKRFAGRTEILASLIRAIEEQRQHVVIYGARGVGKTSLLHVLTQAARDVRYVVVYISCGADSSFDEIFRTMAAAIPMLFHGGIGATSAEVETGKTLADILPNTPISPRSASDLLAKIVGTRVILVLDEFDRCESKRFRRDVAELIKNLSDRLVRVQLVIAGVAADLQGLLEHTPSIQRNIFARHVPWMSPQEVRELVSRGANACGLSFGEDAISAIVFAANGSPFLASLIAHRTGLYALDNGRTQILIADTSEAIREASEDFRLRLSTDMQIKLKKFANDGHGRWLGGLGEISLKGGGSFRLEDIRDSRAVLNVSVREEQIMPELIAAGLLKEFRLNNAPAYHFVEEGMAAFLWLSLAAVQHSTEMVETPMSVVHAVLRE